MTSFQCPSFGSKPKTNLAAVELEIWVITPHVLPDTPRGFPQYNPEITGSMDGIPKSAMDPTEVVSLFQEHTLYVFEVNIPTIIIIFSGMIKSIIILMA